jgi:hypothetical protein
MLSSGIEPSFDAVQPEIIAKLFTLKETGAPVPRGFASKVRIESASRNIRETEPRVAAG